MNCFDVRIYNHEGRVHLIYDYQRGMEVVEAILADELPGLGWADVWDADDGGLYIGRFTWETVTAWGMEREELTLTRSTVSEDVNRVWATIFCSALGQGMDYTPPERWEPGFQHANRPQGEAA